MTETATLQWIKENLSAIINQSISESGNVPYTEDWLAAMVMRETGFLIVRYVGQDKTFDEIRKSMRGDYSHRDSENKPQYHGFGFWQIDIDSFPDFVKSDEWQDPHQTCLKAIAILESKRKYLSNKLPGLKQEQLNRSTTAAYNCGEGRVMKAIIHAEDVDRYTFNKDYSKEVWRFRDIYKSIP